MRLGYFSPLPPAPTGIADYSAELLPYLAHEFDIELIVSNGAPRESDPALAPFPRISVAELSNAAARLDLLLYHMGNAPMHADIYRALCAASPRERRRGVVVMHDVVLHHLIAWLTLGHGDKQGYIEALRAEYGEAGAELARLETLGLTSLNRFDYPLNRTVLQSARAVIVHSEYAAQQIQPIVPNTPIAVIPMGVKPMPALSLTESRAAVHLPESAFIVVAFGEIQAFKRITVILEAFAAFHAQHSDALLLLVGRESPNYDVRAVIAARELESAVQLVGFAAPGEYEQYIGAADVCLNLRYPTAGETSASLLRLMAAGKTTIVTRTGAFAELPEQVCLQVEPDEYEDALLFAYLQYLAEQPDARAAIGAQARRFVETCHTLEQSAAAYADFLRTVHAGTATSKSYLSPFQPAPLTRLRRENSTTPISSDSTQKPSTAPKDWFDELALNYAELGLSADDALLREVADALRELGLKIERNRADSG